MALADIVNLTITRDSVGVARAGFGVPLILSANASFTDRIRWYTSLSAVAVDFPVTTSPEYLAANALFAQDPHPKRIAIGRCALPPTQVYSLSLVTAAAGREYALDVAGEGVTATEVTYTALADVAISAVTNGADSFTSVAHGMATGDGPYRLTNSGGGLPAGSAADTDYWIIRLTADTFSIASSYANAIALTAVNLTTDGTGTHTLQRDANDVIVSQLVYKLNQVAGKNFTAARVNGAGDTDTFTVTGDAAGEWFSISVQDVTSLVSAQTHADPGVATDLTAIYLVSQDWYALYTLYNSNAYVLAAAAWIEARALIYCADLSETATATTTVGNSDTADDLHTLDYARTFVAYSSKPSEMAGAAWLGDVLPLEPGSETWAFKTLTGVTPETLTDTHETNIKARKANSYHTIAGLNVTFDGTMASGEWIDVTRGLDWLKDDMSKACFEVLAGASKIPFTDAGVSVIKAAVRASLKRAAAKGIITDDWDVSAPLVADVSDADKAARNLPDVKFSATLAGAVQSMDINGTVSL